MAVELLDANADTGKDPGEGLTDEQKRARGDIVDDDDDPDKKKADDPDPDALAAVAGDEDDPDGKKSKTVPHGRFNEVNEELRTEREGRIRAEERARIAEENAKAPAKAAPPVDLRALRKQANAKLMEGDEDAALEIQEQIDAELKRQAKTEAKTEAIEEFTAASARREINEAAERVMTKYPFLDSNNAETRNAEAIESVIVWRNHYITEKGMTPGRALEKAAEKIAPAYAPKAKDDPDDKGDDPDKKRSEQAITRGATTAAKQAAPPIGGKGNRTAKDADASIDVAKMSDKEFKAMPAEEKRRLRGDTV